jgi:uncharacterized membrane protein
MDRLSWLAAWSRRPWLVVATIGLIAGLGFALLTPPLTGYDEPSHFLRTYEVSEGHLIATQYRNQLGGQVPAELPGALGRLLVDGMFSPDRTRFVKHLGDSAAGGPNTFIDFAPSAVYSPVPYAPAALLMGIGRAVGASTLMLMYLGRIGSLLGTVGLLCFAVRRMPTRKWLFAAVALLPVTVLQSSMLSADGVTIALALLVLALALNLAATPRREVTKRQLVEVGIATVALGFAKPPYILFSLAFVIAMRRHDRAVVRALVASVAAGFAATAAWGAYATSVYIPPNFRAAFGGVKLGTFTVYTHVNPSRQERNVLHHPWSFAQTIGRTVSTYWPNLTRETLTQVPLWKVPLLAVIAAAAILGASVLLSDSRTPGASTPAPGTPSAPLLGWRSRAVLLAIAATTFVALMLLAYTGWNAVGSPRVEAFQGRYLLPLVPITLIALIPEGSVRRLTNWPVGRLLAASSGLLLVFVWLGLRNYFY